MRTDVAKYVNACHPCQSVKTHRNICPQPAHRPVLPARFSDLMLDICGPLPASQGNKYLLTILDRTTRFVDALPLQEATAYSCCQAFIAHWVSRFGLPTKATSDHGNTFIAQMWTHLHEALGVLVDYTPVYSPQSLGGLERRHRDLKSSLKAALVKMGDTHGSNWLSVLPWTLLGLRTAHQEDLGASPMELVYGQTVKIPGDLVGGDLHQDSDLPTLLENIRKKTFRPAVQTAHHNVPYEHLPTAMETAERVYVRRGKHTPLGANFDGPFKIHERQGNHCLRVRVGSYNNGEPRYELHHWKNCKIDHGDGTDLAERPKLGRKSSKRN